MKTLFTVAAILAAILSGPASAGDANASDHPGHMKDQQPAMPMNAEPATDGVVHAIDRQAGTITVEHGPIKSMNMGAMTMPYHVKDRAMLNAVKPGDKIKMSVEKLGNMYTITAMRHTQ